MKIRRIYAQYLEVGDNIIVTGEDGDCRNRTHDGYIATITHAETNRGGYTFTTLEFSNGDSTTANYYPDSSVLVITNFNN